MGAVGRRGEGAGPAGGVAGWGPPNSVAGRTLRKKETNRFINGKYTPKIKYY